MGRVLLGVVLGILFVPVALMGWLRFGSPPVAVADPPFFQERLLTGIPLHARINREMVKSPIIQPDEAAWWPARASTARIAPSATALRANPRLLASTCFPPRRPYGRSITIMAQLGSATTRRARLTGKWSTASV